MFFARGTVTGPNGPALAVGSVWFGAHPLAPLGVAVVLVALALLPSFVRRGQGAVEFTFATPAVILSAAKNLLAETFLNPHRRVYRLATLSFTLLIFLPITTHAAVFRPDVDDNWPARSSDYFFYVHTDYLGSSNLLTEGEAKTTHGGFRFVRGELVQRIEYTPFGKERLVLNSALEELPKYTGQTDDLETDLYYYGSRYYDPVLGRFIQPDSIIADVYSSQALNGYAYVLGNPLRYIDPLGYAASERDNYKADESDLSSDDASSASNELSGEGTASSELPSFLSDQDKELIQRLEKLALQFGMDSYGSLSIKAGSAVVEVLVDEANVLIKNADGTIEKVSLNGNRDFSKTEAITGVSSERTPGTPDYAAARSGENLYGKKALDENPPSTLGKVTKSVKDLLKLINAFTD